MSQGLVENPRLAFRPRRAEIKSGALAPAGVDDTAGEPEGPPAAALK